jgi:microcystin degradation protein MlrC
MTAPRIGVVSVWHETNAYSRRLAGRAQWEEYELLDGAAFAAAHRGTRSVVGGFLDVLGDAAVPITGAGAWPSGPAPADVLAHLLDRVSEGLRAAGPLDGVAVNLHGAMVADGEGDVEARILETIRDVVGDVPIAAVHDLHGNPSTALVALVDVLVAYRTYPHVDMGERGAEAARLLLRAVAGERFVTTIAKRPILTSPLAQGTDGPLGRVVADLVTRAEVIGIPSVSVLAGFPYADEPRIGMSVLAVSTPEQAPVAAALAESAADRLAELDAAGAFRVARPTAAEAVAEAIAADARPAVLVDLADNIGAGSAGDGTLLLAELLRQGARDAVVVIADAEVVASARAAGVGATVEARLGGKVDDLHGDPVPVVAEVLSLGDGGYVSGGSWATGVHFEMGDVAVLRADGVTILVTTRATPPFHREHLTSVGIDPSAAGILVAKSAVAWRAAYGDDARTVVEVDTPGACPIDPWTLPRTRRPETVTAVAPRLEGASS